MAFAPSNGAPSAIDIPNRRSILHHVQIGSSRPIGFEQGHDMRLPMRLLTILVIGLSVVGCGSPAGSSAQVAPSPVAATTSSGSFTDVPFTLSFPDGWVYAPEQDLGSVLNDLAKTNPEYAQKLQAIASGSPAVTSEFVAYDVGSSDDITPSISCNTLDRGDISIAAALNAGEEQNLEGVAEYPGIVGSPTSDRIQLPVGETVRIRWRITDPAGVDLTAIGYLFVSGPTVYICVFSAGTPAINTHEPEWEAILRTFEAKPSASPGVSARTYVVDQHDAPEVEGLLPTTVAGRRLATWSVRGKATLDLWGLSANDIAVIDTKLASAGVQSADIIQATAGRADVQQDPPYFVFAFQIPTNAADLLGGYAIAAAGFAREIRDGDLIDRTVGGKAVSVGPADLIVQDEHERGLPYLYEYQGIAFVVITDDATWAADAISQLP